jgi:uncharacterized protein (TIGR00251 family)
MSKRNVTSKAVQVATTFTLPPYLNRYKPDSHSVLIKFLVKPGAKMNNITTTVSQLSTSDEIGVQIAAPPRDGEANEEVIEYTAQILSLKRRNLQLHSGHKARNKQVLVSFESDDCDNKNEQFTKNAQYIITKLKENCSDNE